MLSQNKKNLLIGQTVFNPQVATYITVESSQILAKQVWNISPQRYQNQNWSQILSNIIKTQVIQLNLQNNNLSPIVHLVKINFQALLWLSLDSNNIDNAQIISTLNTPRLQHLIISYNNIANIDCLYKSNMKNLAHLVMEGNPIHAVQFSRMKQDSIGKHCIYWQYYKDQANLNQDLSVFAKFETTNIERINIKSQNRIRQKYGRLGTMLISKYPQIILY